MPRSTWSEGSMAVASYENTQLDHMCKKCGEALCTSAVQPSMQSVKPGNPELLVKEYGAFHILFSQ